MKKLKLPLIILASFILGIVAAFFSFDLLIEKLDERETINFQHAEIFKGIQVAEGKPENIIMLIRAFIENGICKDPEMQHLYEYEPHKEIISKDIIHFYKALNEEPPSHVQTWLEQS
ncbi:MAG: hypothetical protein ABGY95_01735 [Rubritalea sp.]|uniref:hypothetical protein n=1 Tax=Rubritalea sp. TaxID=2109375 RepID=UPI003241EFA3